MAGIPDGTLRLTFSGTYVSSAEKWAFTLYFSGYTGINDGSSFPYDATTEPTSTTYTNWRTAWLAQLLSNDVFTQIDAYWYQGGVAVQHGSVVVNHPGTSGNQPQAAQVAMVITMRTALATRSGRGRIYIPARGAGVSTAGMFATTAVNGIVDAQALWFTSIATGNPTRAVVVSQTLGASHTITSVDADVVPDTQRRRRNKLTAARHSHTV